MTRPDAERWGSAVTAQQLAEAIKRIVKESHIGGPNILPQVTLRFGTVNTINGDNTLDVSIGGDTVTPHVKKARSYGDAVVGDIVFLLETDQGVRIVLGAVG